MPRQRSRAAIDREIRRERRELKHAERERKRAEREARLARHENAKQGVGSVAAQDNEPCYASLRNYHPWHFCEVGHHAVRENLMHDHDTCIDCAEGGPIKGHVRAVQDGPRQQSLFPQGE